MQHRKWIFLLIIWLLLGGIAWVASGETQNGSRTVTNYPPARGDSTEVLLPDTAHVIVKDIRANLRNIEETIRQSDQKARQLGSRHALGSSIYRAKMGKLGDQLKSTQLGWIELRQTGDFNADTILTNRLRRLAGESSNLLMVIRQAVNVDLAAMRVRSGLVLRDGFSADIAGGGISGIVKEQGSGTPLPSIAVVVFDENDWYVSEALTDTDGQYEVSPLDDGTYFLKTYNYSQYVDELYNNIECAGGGGWGGCDHLAGTPVVVTGGAITPGIDFRLRLGGTISGTVTDEDGGAGIENLRVDIYDPDGGWMSFNWTDPNGDYIGLQGLPSGNYFVMTDAGYEGLSYLNEIYDGIGCNPPHWQCDPTVGAAVAVTIGNETPGIDFELALGGSIGGNITDQASGLPVEDAGVDIYKANGDWVTSAYTDSNGDYLTYDGLPTATYYALSWNGLGYINELYDNFECLGCDQTTGTPIQVTEGQETSGIDFALDRGGTISGVITDELLGTPIQGIQVYMLDSDGNWMGVWANSREDGHYTTESGLPSGKYLATTYNWMGLFRDEVYDDIDCSTSDCDVTTGDRISVTAGSDTPSIDFALLPADSIFVCNFEDGNAADWSAVKP